jgi:hypothetical protein
MIELITVHEPETVNFIHCGGFPQDGLYPKIMIPTYSNRMIGTYQKLGESKKPLIPHVPLSKLEMPPPEKPSLIKRILKWFEKHIRTKS